MDKVPHAIVNPLKSLNLLSQADIASLTASDGDLLAAFRHCALAILNTDSQQDDAAEIDSEFSDFDIRLVPQPRGLRLEIINAPSQSFVDGKMIRGIQEHLFSALRDIVYTDLKIIAPQSEPLSSAEATNTVFRILRNARIVRPDLPPNMVVCWGGHSIAREEYDYTKEVGYHLGLRGLDICTGCGPGAMKGPMKGAAVGHAKQRLRQGRYLGLTEPGIDRVIRTSYGVLGLISFFTVGEDEVRAWPIEEGDNAVTAAGKIHTDLARGFIRAETMSYGDLKELGGEKEVKAAGKSRLEGKAYVVQDGDIINFRFNV